MTTERGVPEALGVCKITGKFHHDAWAFPEMKICCCRPPFSVFSFAIIIDGGSGGVRMGLAPHFHFCGGLASHF